MRETDHQQSGMFSYISAERRVPKDHPLRAIRVMVDAALKESSWRFDAVYASSGRPSIAPEKLLRALLLQVLYTVRSDYYRKPIVWSPNIVIDGRKFSLARLQGIE
jgi:transposase